MADATKYVPIGGGNLATDLKSLFTILKTRKTVTFAYAFIIVFVAFTVFLAFTPSQNASSPWFTNIFSSSTTATTITTADSYKSQLASIFSYFFPNNTTSASSSSSSDLDYNPNFSSPSSDPINNTSRSSNATSEPLTPYPNAETFKETSLKNQTQSLVNSSQDAVPVSTTIPTTDSHVEASGEKNHTGVIMETPNGNINVSTPASNVSVAAAPSLQKVPGGSNHNLSSDSAVGTGSVKGVESNNNYTASLAKRQSNGNKNKPLGEKDELMESLIKCDFFDGEWARDDSYPLYMPGSCALIDEQFNCIRNGRPDKNYQKYKWKPKGCSLPRLDAHRMLDLLRGKRMVFVGDSLNRNMWESLICILRNAVKDKRNVYEVNGRVHFRGEAAYSFIFKDYNFTVELFVSPFLVQEWEMPDKNGTKKETLRLDLVGGYAEQYKNADIIIFNTGHWWTHDKTSKGKDYYQEGSHVYDELNVLEAFRRAITTWSRWVDANINPFKTMVLFRGYSASHFSGGQWNSGGACDSETEPIDNEVYLTEYPPKMRVLENVLKSMKTHVSYMNITRMTDFRKDGHPSIYRKQNLSPEERKSPLRYQDCSHWCLPGVPDAWNEILYAELLMWQYQSQHQKKRA